MQELIEEKEEKIRSEEEPDLRDDLFQELEDLVEVPTEELVEDASDEDLPDELLDELGSLFHDINLQPLLSRADEFRLFVLIQAGRKLDEVLLRWENINDFDNVINATLNIYQKTADIWNEFSDVCTALEIPQPDLGEIFSEIFLQRILHLSYNSTSLADWFDILPAEGPVREKVGQLILEIPISTMILPVEAITWISGHLARNERKFPDLSDLANWIINAYGLKFDTQELMETSQQAHDKMVLSNLRLVVWIAKRYQGRGIELADLVQVGTIGLLKAVEKFNPVNGYKFSTYATWWVRQTITRDIADNSRLIRLPVHLHDRVVHVLRIRDNLIQRLHRRPTPDEIASETPILLLIRYDGFY